MIPAVLDRYLPEWVRSLRSERSDGASTPAYALTPFDVLFPEAEKRHWRAPVSVSTPEMMDVPLWHEAGHLKRTTYRTPADYTTTLHDVLYCPVNNVILTEDRQVVAETVDKKRLRETPAFEGPVRDLPGWWTLLRSPGEAYYHVLIDRLPRLVALDRPPYSDLDAIQLPCPGGLNRLESYYLPRVAPANMRPVELALDGLYRMEHLIFTPFKTQRFVGFVPEPYMSRFRSAVLPDRPARPRHRLFISREKQPQRRIANRDAVMEALRPLGFERVIPEELPLDDEIELFYDAEVVVGPHGAGFTNVVFSVQVQMLELYPTRFMVPHFYFLCKALGHGYHFLCGEGTRRYPTSYEVDVPAVVEKLKEMGVA